MTQTAVRRMLAAILTSTALVALAAPGAAAQRVPTAPAARQPQAAPPAPPATAPAFQEEQRAEQTRDQLNRLFEMYPPQIGRVLKLDPTLITSDSYLAPYPQLSAFVAAHPEIAHNSAYFLGNVEGFPSNDPRRRDREDMLGVLAGIGVFLAFLVITSVLVWLIRMAVLHRRWNRLSRVQFETHTKLLDRFTSNEELLAYIQTPAGRRFLEAAPIPMQDEAPSIAAPLSRILWSVQAGIILAVVGFGLTRISHQFSDEPAHLFSVAGMLLLALGGGFILSAVAAYMLSRRLGLLERPAEDHA
ncbi:MAG: hypothetical protein ABI603_06995 [Acidobacteriota bacterium]